MRLFRLLPVLLCLGCGDAPPPTPPKAAPTLPTGTVASTPNGSRTAPKPTETIPNPKNFFFTTQPLDATRLPTLRSIPLPAFHAAAAVWGSTGRDHRGKIYIGVSTDGDDYLSAHLVELDPETGTTTLRGGAVENLKRLGLNRPNENQNKIHTKIWQARDGYLYFASLDEGGENEDGSQLPTFGSHLWRVKPGESEWEHLAEVREAVIASAMGGRYLYYLGYYGHVLYQWDTQTGRMSNRVRVGSVGGHTTRNIIADDRGHVFVPRVSATEPTRVELVEFDEQLQELARTPLDGYSTAPDPSSHGIVGVVPMKNDGVVFITDRGRLYRITPRATGSAVVDLGYFHPDGETYTATLFTYDGESSVVGIGHKPTAQLPNYEWITYDLKTRKAKAEKIAPPIPGSDSKSILIYGCTTRDEDGRMYLAGRFIRKEGEQQSVPIVWQVSP
jgi:hypothetical protein